MGKASSILLPLVFYPLYRLILGDEGFGQVGVFYAIQSFLLLYDFGLTTQTSREIALERCESRQIVHVGLNCFVLLYGILLLVSVLMLNYFGRTNLIELAIFTIVTCFFVVTHNFYYQCLLAKRDYGLSTLQQFLGQFAKAIAILFALYKIGASIEVFILTNLIFSGIHAYSAKRIFEKKYCNGEFYNGWFVFDLRNAVKYIKKCLPINGYTIFGAVATQLDKPLIALFIDASSVTPYFLALTLASVPQSLVASPIAQYFQPKLLQAYGLEKKSELKDCLEKYTIFVSISTAISVIALFCLASTVVNYWLGLSKNNESVVHFVRILLPGIFFSGIGFIPYSLILATNEHRAQIIISGFLCFSLLILQIFYATAGQINLMCVSLVIFHFLSTSAQWVLANSKVEIQTISKSSQFISLVFTIFLIIFLIIAEWI